MAMNEGQKYYMNRGCIKIKIEDQLLLSNYLPTLVRYHSALPGEAEPYNKTIFGTMNQYDVTHCQMFLAGDTF